MLKFVVDDKIPFIKGVFEPYAQVCYVGGSSMSSEDVKDADALIVRTRTKCNASLLEGSRVRFIATATIGFDHIDADYCSQHGILWKNAPGCNAPSVAQYVASALMVVARRFHWNLLQKTIGIVGVGHVGSQVERMARILGMNVLLCDPPRASREGMESFVSIETVCRESDVISFHTPLVSDGDFPTVHMADADFFSSLVRKPVVINAARGAVFDTKAAKVAIAEGEVSGLVVDCWENEPSIDLDLLSSAILATPHVAGYSADGKANATTQAVQAVARYFHITPLCPFSVAPPTPSDSNFSVSGVDSFSQALLHSYDIEADDSRLRGTPDKFESLRGNYPLRREYGAYTVAGCSDVRLCQLGFSLV